MTLTVGASQSTSHNSSRNFEKVSLMYLGSFAAFQTCDRENDFTYVNVTSYMLYKRNALSILSKSLSSHDSNDYRLFGYLYYVVVLRLIIPTFIRNSPLGFIPKIQLINVTSHHWLPTRHAEGMAPVEVNCFIRICLLYLFIRACLANLIFTK